MIRSMCSSQIRFGVAVPADHEFGAIGCKFLSIFQVRSKFWKNRHCALTLPLVVLGLRISHDHSAGGQVDVAPSQCQMLRRTLAVRPNGSEQNQSPLVVWASSQDPFRLFLCDEIESARVRLCADPLHVSERAFGDQPLADRRPEKLFGDSASALDRALAEFHCYGSCRGLFINLLFVRTNPVIERVNGLVVIESKVIQIARSLSAHS